MAGAPGIVRDVVIGHCRRKMATTAEASRTGRGAGRLRRHEKSISTMVPQFSSDAAC